MFFVSEEFLRKYQAGEEVEQTIGDAVPEGAGRFGDSGTKREHNVKRREEKARASKGSAKE